MTEPQVVHAPIAPNGDSGVIYQVTLATGLVLTSPNAFGSADDAGLTAPGPVLSEAGELLAPQPVPADAG
jgi:hypothetical protein